MNNKTKNIIKWALCAVAAILAIIIAINIKNGKILDFDLKIYQFFKSNIINEKLTPIVLEKSLAFTRSPRLFSPFCRLLAINS